MRVCLRGGVEFFRCRNMLRCPTNTKRTIESRDKYFRDCPTDLQWLTARRHSQVIHAARSGGWVGYVGVPHEVELNGEELFFEHVHLHGGLTPMTKFGISRRRSQPSETSTQPPSADRERDDRQRNTRAAIRPERNRNPGSAGSFSNNQICHRADQSEVACQSRAHRNHQPNAM